MSDILTDDEIAAALDEALEQHQFTVYYQAQYSHTSGALVGAEALVRWNHPQKGFLAPASFLPALERSGRITDIDFYVFEEVCRFQNRCLEQGLHCLPVSINASRMDFYLTDFASRLEAVRQRQGTSAKLLRIEVTESVLGLGERTHQAIDALHQAGYIVEMDDFGSGYSSLNALKDLDFDIIKLDMRFLQGQIGGRGGIILNSVVNMANWLGIPVIAEGVEAAEQADFLRSIGCELIQGYLYARPEPEDAYAERLRSHRSQAIAPALRLIKRLDPARFCSPDSLETLIFNNYVGGAAIFQHEGDGRLRILRVNPKYLTEIGMNMTEHEVIATDPTSLMDPASRTAFVRALHEAIDSGEEAECETWRTFHSKCCGESRLCLRTQMRVIGSTGPMQLIYAMVRNITEEKRRFQKVSESELRFRKASDQANIYCWEYTVATREMRPCFRCMRDLGLPALVTNYPEPAIEMGIFPPDYADMYRDWHRQIAAGVPHLEAVIPLTVGRIPFHVRYTTEFDEAGHPVKAYGSATLVIDATEENSHDRK